MNFIALPPIFYITLMPAGSATQLWLESGTHESPPANVGAWPVVW